MTTKTAFSLRILMWLSILGLLLAGCSTSAGGSLKAGPGVDTQDKVIKLGVLSPLSGVVGQLIGVPLTNGIETYFKFVNDNGGIKVGSDHYKITLVERDVPYPDTQAQVQYYNAIHNDVLSIAESLGTPGTFAIKDLAAQDHMLVSAATLASSLAREQYLYLVGTPYRLQTENAFDYVVNKLGDTNPKVGIIYQNDEYGTDGLTGYKEAVAAYHLNDVGQLPFKAGDTDFTSQISALKAAGAKYVFQASTISVSAGIIGAAYGLGYTPQWILQSPAWSEVFLANAKLLPLLQHFVWVVGQGATWGDTSKTGMAEMLQNVQKYIPAQQPDGYFEFGYTEAKITAAILQKAASNNDLTRDGMYNAFTNLGNVDLGGLYPSASYGAASTRVPTRDSVIFKIDPTAPGGAAPLTDDFVGTAAAASQF